ncbi:hypothetical protein BJ138DRAFT_1180100 [Hygrophoropsis aurantiaca]|uniref:Uncharacterized protein n=1 Tax=Hygrophoropsis aurantiaca TaxID=72124 RepID=A0ACB8ABI9_9AGAM|nr:hypothetical protein BJ138DRAFT_1180100 [Hygrophoropsis aurantiaca]
MPGPGAKAKRPKPKSANSSSIASTSGSNVKTAEYQSLIDDVAGTVGWGLTVAFLCDYFALPDLSKRSGLKKVFANFETIYQRIDKVYVAHQDNWKLVGGIICIYTKMCADSILRNRLFQKGLLAKIMPLLDMAECRSLALRLLTTITHHGGMEVRQDISRQTPRLLRVLQEFPDDLVGAELVISTLAHALGAAINVEETPTASDAKLLNIPLLLRVVTGIMRKPDCSIQLLHHGMELLTHPSLHFWKECKAYPPVVDFYVACLRTGDLSVRCAALGALMRLEGLSAESDQRFNDPHKLMAAAQNGFPGHLTDILMDYGPMNCEMTLTLRSTADNQRIFMKCAQDHDLYALGIGLVEIILRNEFSVGDGYFQFQNEQTGQMEIADVGLPFKKWGDALPHCAKAIRARRPEGAEDMADVLDMKFYIMRSRVGEAVAMARKSIQRNPKFPYFYYVITLGKNLEDGLRSSKKGLKCKKITPFVRFGLMHRAVEIAGNLGVCRLQEASTGDRKWEEGIAFLASAMEDAKSYVAEAPPDARHMKNVLYWYICLTITMKGTEMSLDLHELQDALRKLKAADEFSTILGTIPPKTQLRMTQQNIIQRYDTPGVKEWRTIVARFDNTSLSDIPEPLLSPEKVEDDLAAWLDEMHLDHNNAHSHPETCSHPRISLNTVELYRCSWCGNPSAVLRKCSGCGKTRYCDNGCQKMHWADHKVVCKT